MKYSSKLKYFKKLFNITGMWHLHSLACRWRCYISVKQEKKLFLINWLNMAAARRLKRVAASQPGFMHLKSSSDPATLVSSRRKRVNKNKKKNWNKHSDINDVEDFLEDIRHQERTTG